VTSEDQVVAVHEVIAALRGGQSFGTVIIGGNSLGSNDRHLRGRDLT